MNVTEIMALLPHRYPFLMLDRIVEVEPGQRVVAIKNVSINEPQFTGHFPGAPVMPGVLVVEALAQACGVVAISSAPSLGNKLIYLVALNDFRFRRPVTPGDQLRIIVQKTAEKRSIWVFDARAEVDGKVVVEGEVMATVADPPGQAG